MAPPRRARTATNRAPPGSNMNFYPIRNWRLGQHLVVIGRHTYRTLESYDWEPLDALALDLAAARGAMRLDAKKPLTLPDRSSEVTPDLEDEHTIVVSRQPIHEQMAESITVLPTAGSRSQANSPQPPPTATPTHATTTPATNPPQPPPTATPTHATTTPATNPPPTATPSPALQPQIPIIDHDDLSIPASWLEDSDIDDDSDTDSDTETGTVTDDSVQESSDEEQGRNRQTSKQPPPPPPLPDAKQAERLSAHTCSWLAAEFQDMAKYHAAEHDDNYRFQEEMTSITTSIRSDLQSLTKETGDALLRLIQENRLIKTLLDTILSELQRTHQSREDSQGSSSESTSRASTQAVDIHPFPKCPPDNTPASDSGSGGSTPGPNNPPPPRSARPNRPKGRPEDTAMKFSNAHLNKDCLPYSQGNLYTSRHAAHTATKEAEGPHQQKIRFASGPSGARDALLQNSSS